MDDLDYKILDELQRNFPIAADPYSIIAEKLEVSEDKLFDRVSALVDDGTIRRIGVSMDSRKLGCASTLAAIRVDKKQVETACGLIDCLSEITHSYLRNDEFNIWFAVIAPNKSRLEQVLSNIKTELKLSDDDILNLPVEKLFKLDARFRPGQ